MKRVENCTLTCGEFHTPVDVTSIFFFGDTVDRVMYLLI